MALKMSVADLISNPGVGKLIKIIAENRRIRFNSLVAAADSLEVENPKAILEQMKAFNLIGEQPPTLPDFTTYYVTSDGLELDRKLRRMGLYSEA
jgi:hypothetical protein